MQADEQDADDDRAPNNGARDRPSRVADLVSEGATNQEVAARLFMSPKTVEWNLSRIYRKLGVRSRTELAAHLHES